MFSTELLHLTLGQFFLAYIVFELMKLALGVGVALFGAFLKKVLF